MGPLQLVSVIEERKRPQLQFAGPKAKKMHAFKQLQTASAVAQPAAVQKYNWPGAPRLTLMPETSVCTQNWLQGSRREASDKQELLLQFQVIDRLHWSDQRTSSVQYILKMDKVQQKCEAAGLSKAAIDAFKQNYEQLVAGVTGLVSGCYALLLKSVCLKQSCWSNCQL